ncbi:MAG TPA: SpoIID/LytB domain-containing protein [Symbiobacteriaceae bacterium]|nr:SpoIID/LytB domain-containing protein [Symbiobacteriaceae bacterium]
MKRLCSFLLLVTVLLGPATAFAQQRTIYNTPYPSTIRVAIREARPNGDPNPRGRIIYVKAVNFDDYVVNSLPNEWVPSWNQEALQAGAMAVKMFAWHKTLNPTKLDGWEFHVDNTTNFQTYREGNRFKESDEAHQRVRNLAYTMPNGEIVELNYRAGIEKNPNWQYRNANMMAQWGSHYWAERGQNMLQILQWYYQGRALHRIPNL